MFVVEVKETMVTRMGHVYTTVNVTSFHTLMYFVCVVTGYVVRGERGKTIPKGRLAALPHNLLVEVCHIGHWWQVYRSPPHT